MSIYIDVVEKLSILVEMLWQRGEESDGNDKKDVL